MTRKGFYNIMINTINITSVRIFARTRPMEHSSTRPIKNLSWVSHPLRMPLSCIKVVSSFEKNFKEGFKMNKNEVYTIWKSPCRLLGFPGSHDLP